MSIASEIARLRNAKAAIKAALEEKGVVVSENATLDQFPALIESISTSQEPDPTPVDPDPTPSDPT